MQVQSDKRSDYRLRVVGFDEVALSVMLLRKDQVITVTVKSSYWRGYQLAASSITLYCCYFLCIFYYAK
ncbi:hypothetical protein [Xenorhabdus cabanillasii]|uniref:hypothetical protein n=1 Tax=Xenorhabdus cabanillasii TaxID=351673 RepID=UPI002B4038AB|nr:hypothetical protein [Xenorhabdus sp. Flor]